MKSLSPGLVLFFLLVSLVWGADKKASSWDPLKDDPFEVRWAATPLEQTRTALDLFVALYGHLVRFHVIKVRPDLPFSEFVIDTRHSPATHSLYEVEAESQVPFQSTDANGETIIGARVPSVLRDVAYYQSQPDAPPRGAMTLLVGPAGLSRGQHLLPVTLAEPASMRVGHETKKIWVYHAHVRNEAKERKIIEAQRLLDKLEDEHTAKFTPPARHPAQTSGYGTAGSAPRSAGR